LACLKHTSAQLQCWWHADSCGSCCAAGLYSKPQFFDYAHARKEFEVTCFSAIKDLLNKTGMQPHHMSDTQQGHTASTSTAESLLVTSDSTATAADSNSHEGSRCTRGSNLFLCSLTCSRSSPVRHSDVCLCCSASTFVHRCPASPDQHGDHKQQPVQPHTQSQCDHHEPLQDAPYHAQLQPGRHGLLSRCAHDGGAAALARTALLTDCMQTSLL
jgi:hypothetical protein